jgi:hypothetical protein
MKQTAVPPNTTLALGVKILPVMMSAVAEVEPSG